MGCVIVYGTHCICIHKFDIILTSFLCFIVEGIIDVRLDTTDSYKLGFVEVQFKEHEDSIPEWLPVCNMPNHQNDESWGKEEARVTCRQLKFEGGWPYTDYSDFIDIHQQRAIDDIRCNGGKSCCAAGPAVFCWFIVLLIS